MPPMTPIILEPYRSHHGASLWFEEAGPTPGAEPLCGLSSFVKKFCILHNKYQTLDTVYQPVRKFREFWWLWLNLIHSFRHQFYTIFLSTIRTQKLRNPNLNAKFRWSSCERLTRSWQKYMQLHAVPYLKTSTIEFYKFFTMSTFTFEKQTFVFLKRSLLFNVYVHVWIFNFFARAVAQIFNFTLKSV